MANSINLNILRATPGLNRETIMLFNTLDGYRTSTEEDNAVSVEELKLLDVNENGKFEAREDLLEALNRLTGGHVSGISAQFYDEVRSVLQKYPEVACKAFPKDSFCGGSPNDFLELIEGPLTTALLSQQSYQGSVVFNAGSVRALKEAALVINPRLSTLLGELFEAMKSTHSLSQMETVEEVVAKLNDEFFVPAKLYVNVSPSYDGNGTIVLFYLAVGKVEKRESVENPYRAGKIQILYLSDMNTRFEREANVSLHPMGITEGQTEPDVSIYTRNTTGSRGPKVNMDEVRKEAKSVSAILNGKDSNPVYQIFRAAKAGASYSTITRNLSLATRTHELRHVYDISLGGDTSEASAYFAELFLSDWQFSFVSQVNQIFDWNGSHFSAKPGVLSFEHPTAFANVLGILAQELPDPVEGSWSKISDGPPSSDNMPIEKIYKALEKLPDRTAFLQTIYDKYF